VHVLLRGAFRKIADNPKTGNATKNPKNGKTDSEIREKPKPIKNKTAPTLIFVALSK
jgi:hypothetical protein